MLLKNVFGQLNLINSGMSVSHENQQLFKFKIIATINDYFLPISSFSCSLGKTIGSRLSRFDPKHQISKACHSTENDFDDDTHIEKRRRKHTVTMKQKRI